ncbi:MAG: ABC transporter ATP-binding protein [Fimbriimonadaceae bacterium]|nr:ABC transporter ATP-binding protein [Fimbriimonadaceae bacterium]
MIEFTGASRWYGQVIGINDVNCQIMPGITALLGQNGAGKTTMMRLITGQLKTTTGSVSVKGLDPYANPDVFKHLGYCPDIDNFYEHMTGYQFVFFLARMAGFDNSAAKSRTLEMLQRVGMLEASDRKIAGYSKGMRQRIKLAQAMLHDPEIILLDEPLNGLDPMGRRQLMDLLGELANEGKTIIVSSHILFEVEQMTRNVLLLHRGRLLATGNIRVIRELIDKYPQRIRVDTSEPRAVASKLVELPYVLNVRFEPNGRSLELQTREPAQFYDFLPTLALEHGLPIEGFSSPDNNLEAVFRYLVEA